MLLHLNISLVLENRIASTEVFINNEWIIVFLEQYDESHRWINGNSNNFTANCFNAAFA